MEFLSLKGGCTGSSESTLVKKEITCHGSFVIICSVNPDGPIYVDKSTEEAIKRATAGPADREIVDYADFFPSRIVLKNIFSTFQIRD